MIRRLVRTVLEADEFEVVEARDGESALQLATEAHPAVVVLDIMMPGLDGVEVCRRLDHQQVKVIVLTARDEPDLEKDCRQAGANAFVTKPFSSVQLLDVVAELIAS
jgi:two-component system response regulator ResD